MSEFSQAAAEVKNKFISWDFFISLAITAFLFFIIPDRINLNFAMEMYSVGITMLTMCIFYFLAILALLVSASDEGFILFLKDEGIYLSIFNTYRYTIVVLFVGLMYMLVMYGHASFSKHMMPNVNDQNRYMFLSFLFLFIYAVFTVFESCLDSVNYLKVRVRYLALKRAQRSSGHVD